MLFQKLFKTLISTKGLLKENALFPHKVTSDFFFNMTVLTGKKTTVNTLHYCNLNNQNQLLKQTENCIRTRMRTGPKAISYISGIQSAENREL